MARGRADYESAIRQSVNLRRVGSSFGLVVAGSAVGESWRLQIDGPRLYDMVAYEARKYRL